MDLRNVAIIAHVDHGKTTLVDAMLKAAHALSRGQEAERMLDTEDLERERGITILAKNTAVIWQGVKINIVDTPGHADFGGEVERALSMVDGVLLLVDAVEGPMPQTRFVLRKALEADLRPVVVLNKVDREGARPDEVLSETFDLMVELGASEAQLDFPYLYAIGREGKVWREGETPRDMAPLFEALVEHIPPPKASEGPFLLRVANLDRSDYLGRIAIGKVVRGRAQKGQTVAIVGGDGVREQKILALYTHHGLGRIETEAVVPGDIVALAGMEEVAIGDTIADRDAPEALPRLEVDAPTVAVTLFPNTGPFAGREGRYVTSRQLWARLERELETNVALQVRPLAADAFELLGRGEMHLAVLLENMRRDGYEFVVGPPQILDKTVDGVRLEPYEQLILQVPKDRVGAVVEALGTRKGTLLDLRPEGEWVRIEYSVPARRLFGFRGEFLTLTGGEGVMHQSFLEYGPYLGPAQRRRSGSAVAVEGGRAFAYAIGKLQERVRFFIAPGDEVYPGMVVGEHVRPGDLGINVCKNKKLTNMRAAGSDENVHLVPPRRFALEEALAYLASDELLEVTPRALRFRKERLDAWGRRGSEREKVR